MLARLLLLPMVVLTLALPVFAWMQNTGGFERLFDTHEPPGQSWYVLSRLFGVIALSVGCWQFVIGLSSKFPVALFKKRHHQTVIHGLLGLGTFVLFWAHALCFVTAVSIRKQFFAYGLLLPNMSDYYHAVISIGWLALVLVTIAVAARAFRIRNRHQWHKLVYGVLPLAVIHSALVGSDTRDPLLIANYLLIGTVWLGALYFATVKSKLSLRTEHVA